MAVMYRGRIVEIGRAARCLKTRSTPIPVSSWPPYRWPTRATVIRSGSCCLMTSGNIYKRGEEIASVPLQQVGPGHFVARESADVLGRT